MSQINSQKNNENNYYDCQMNIITYCMFTNKMIEEYSDIPVDLLLSVVVLKNGDGPLLVLNKELKEKCFVQNDERSKFIIEKYNPTNTRFYKPIVK